MKHLKKVWPRVHRRNFLPYKARSH